MLLKSVSLTFLAISDTKKRCKKGRHIGIISWSDFITAFPSIIVSKTHRYSIILWEMIILKTYLLRIGVVFFFAGIGADRIGAALAPIRTFTVAGAICKIIYEKLKHNYTYSQAISWNPAGIGWCNFHPNKLGRSRYRCFASFS